MSALPEMKFDTIPEGDYPLRMQSLEEVKSKKGDPMLKAKFQIFNGDFKGRIVWENYILAHKSQKCVDVNLSKLDNYAKAIGLTDGLETIGHDLTKLQDYVETPFVATLKHKEPYNGRVDSRIFSYKKR